MLPHVQRHTQQDPQDPWSLMSDIDEQSGHFCRESNVSGIASSGVISSSGS